MVPPTFAATCGRAGRLACMSKHTARFFSRLTLSHLVSISLTAGLLVFGFVAVASAEHSLFIN